MKTVQFISHRGNLFGPNPSRENSPDYVDEAIRFGCMVEVDLRCIEGRLYLGHDTPDYPITEEFLNSRSSSLWIHAKDHEALKYLTTTNHNYFWHDTDDYTITSKGYLWAYPSKPALGNLCVCVVKDGAIPTGAWGVCSDNLP